MLAQEISIPVYFVHWAPEIDLIADDLSANIDSNDLSKSAAEAIFSSIAANGYQIVISSSSPTVRNDVKVSTIQGHLSGYNPNSPNGKIPTIAVVAHYDSFGVAPVI